MTSLQVAFLTPLYFDEASCLGGGERYPLNLARGLRIASRGRVRTDLISFGDAERTLDLDEGIGLRVLPVATRPANPLDLTSWEIPRVLADYDLVHVHQVYTRCAEVGVLAAKALGKPVCLTDHGGASSPLGREVGLLDLADRIIAYSAFGASLYRTKRPIDVIKGGVDGSLFRPPANRPARDRVLFVGRLLPHKGIDRLIEALPPHLPLTVCGRPYRPGYLDELRRLASGKRVEFVTDADDARVRDLYARSWATVLPSVYRDRDGRTYEAPELMGFSLLESMACGTPAICSRVGAMPEFVRDGIDGFVFDAIEGLAAILLRLASDPAAVERMGAEARRSIEAEYDLSVAGARLLRLYDDLFAARRGEAA